MPMTGKQLLKLLERNGWRVVRIKGSHHILSKDGTSRPIIVPVRGNRPLATGTEHDILRQAGLK